MKMECDANISRGVNNRCLNETSNNINAIKNQITNIATMLKCSGMTHRYGSLDQSNNSKAALSLFESLKGPNDEKADLFTLYFEQLNKLTLEEVYAAFENTEMSVMNKKDSQNSAVTPKKTNKLAIA